jgi:hypothetical protein
LRGAGEEVEIEERRREKGKANIEHSTPNAE